jgi:broad specificity phosphatase PhoE
MVKMPNLVFIRHSQSQPDPHTPSRLWTLTEEGRRRCEVLADQLLPYNLDVIITSTEPKAIETAELAAQKLEVPCLVMEGLHEHERESAPFFDNKEKFLEAVANLFANRAELVFGDETGFQAHTRFAGAVDAVLAAYPLKNIAIVTHGTVLSLFVSQKTGEDIYEFWQSLGMPAIIAFSYPELRMIAQSKEIT